MSSYGNYIERLSRQINARLSDIEAVYNFDFGDEFEVALCHVLSDILPSKFGICRGFIVAENGEKVGDDLIIFDKLSCPTLRSLGNFQLSIKEQIPVDAVYAYIECKHAINEKEFRKAIKQVREVKSLILTRRSLKNLTYETDGPIYNGKLREDWPRQFPELRNQPFCMIISRYFDGFIPDNIENDNLTPDFLLLGEDHVATQSVKLGPDGIKGALFYDHKHWASLRIETVKSCAFGIGIISLLQALEWIELLPIDWSSTLNEIYWNSLP